MKKPHIQGIGVSEGIRIAKAYIYKPSQGQARQRPDEKNIPDKPAAIDAELIKLREAKASCAEQLDALTEKAKEAVGEEQAGILAGRGSFWRILPSIRRWRVGFGRSWSQRQRPLPKL